MSGADLADVRAAVAAWGAALCRRDVDAVDGLLADTLAYGHSTGVVHDRAGYLRFLATGPTYLAVEIRAPEIRFAGSVALVGGILVQSLIRSGETDPVGITARVLQVWGATPDGWRLLAAQSTRTPG